MIAANVAAARFLDRHRVPTLYRVHGLPELDRLETLRQFLREFGLWLPPAADVAPEHLRELLQQIGDRPDATLISTAVIRTMPQAVYQPGQHRSLRARARALCALHVADPALPGPGRAPRHPPGAARSATRRSCSPGTARSPRSDRIARSASDVPTRPRAAPSSWLKCYYMQEHIGEEFDGIVSGVVDFGLFVQLEGLQVDGLLHVSALGPGLLRARFVRLPHDRSQLRHARSTSAIGCACASATFRSTTGASISSSRAASEPPRRTRRPSARPPQRG